MTEQQHKAVPSKFLCERLVVQKNPRIMSIPIESPLDLFHTMYYTSQVAIPCQSKESSVCFARVGWPGSVVRK